MSDRLRAYVCSNCGAPLDLKMQKGGIIECDHCGTMFKPDNMVRNNEILEKENINSGVMLKSPRSQLHKRVFDLIAGVEASPLDVFENLTIVKEEHVFIPMYLFMVSGSGTFNYEIGQRRQRQVREGDYMVTQNYTEWTPVTQAVSCNKTYFVCGNNDYKKIVDRFPVLMNSGDLIDIEELEMPADAETASFNYPKAAAFENDVKPQANAVLKNMAEGLLNGRNWRNGNITSNIHQDDLQRVYLALYRLTLKYGDETVTVWIDYKGRYAVADKPIVDPEREALISGQRKAIGDVKPKGKGGWIALAVVCAVLMPVCLLLTGAEKLLALIPLAGLIFAIFKMASGAKGYKAKLKAEQSKLQALLVPFERAKEDFAKKKVAFKGIYSSLSGDESAF